MARVFTKQDFYLLIYIMRSWQERDPDERWSDHMRDHWGLGPVNTIRDRDRLVNLAKRILDVIRSYPKEEVESDNEPEATEEGEESSDDDEVTRSE